MKKNVTRPDRVIRLIVAAVLIGLYAAGILTGTVGIVALVIAAVMAVTAVFSFCPLYKILGCCCKPCGKGNCSSSDEDTPKKDACCGGGNCDSKDDK